MKLTENFDTKEFDCRDGSKMPPEVLENIKLVAGQLQILRDHLGEAIHVNSGYRSVAYNTRIGGVKNSQHVIGKAADITVKNKTPRQLAAIIEKLITAGTLRFGGIGIYPGFVHVDIRKNKARW